MFENEPFSRELKKWLEGHDDLLRALKITNHERFISLNAVITSYSPNYPSDQVIGFITYDKGIKNPLFKQDFIINKGELNKEFILYTRLKNQKANKFLKDINEFYATYGKGGYYPNTHHLFANDLPEELRERAIMAMNYAETIKEI